MDNEMRARCMYEFLPNGGEWTTTPPTEPGWYWAYILIDEPIISMVFIDKDGRVFDPDYESDDIYQMQPVGETIFTHWLGPLPVPEPPIDQTPK
jgi:hypothetical protein